MDAGEPCAPTEVIVTCPVYVPADSPEIAALTCSACGAVPFAGVAVSQGASVAVVKLSVPVPVLLTVSSWAAGLAPPAVPLNVRVVGDTDKMG
jgi:hypothetical protein